MRVLQIRPGGIGDCLTCFPAMEHLAPAETEVWVPSAIVPLVQFANSVRAISTTGLDLLGIGAEPPLSLVQAICGFDLILSWYGSNRPEFREAALSINENWRFFPALPPAGSSEHATDFHARLVGAPAQLQPRIEVEPTTKRKTIVIHPFSGGRSKDWPLERFRSLAEKLSLPVEWTCGPEEYLPDAHRFDDLMQLARWMRGASLYIGNDSGITHLAAAAGVPTVALFGASDPNVWRPRGQHVTTIEAGSMDAIGVDAVLCTVESRLHH